MVTLRPYQARTLTRLRGEISSGNRRLLVVAPTGAGKTTIAGKVISGARSKGRKSIFLAHRTELIEQCSDRLDEMGVPHGVIQSGSKRHNPEAEVQVASIQTLIKRDHYDADIIIVDEAHRSTSATYIKILQRYNDPVVLGLTATPYRLDGKGLGQVDLPGQDKIDPKDREKFDLYQSLVEVAGVQELIDLGFLVNPTVYGAPEIDMSNVRVTAGDYNKKDTAKAMEGTVLRGDLLKNWARKCSAATGSAVEFDGDRLVRTDCNACTVVFAPSIRHSHIMVEQFKSVGVSAAHIDGKTPREERARILQDLRERKLTVVSNFGILCLDEETEILTRQGWRTIDTIQDDDDVANWWQNDTITFTKPSEIIKRQRNSHESMYKVHGRRSDIRVTANHRIVFKKRKNSEWLVWPVQDLVDKKWFIPISGYAEPDHVILQTTRSSKSSYSRRIASCSYHLRSNNGLGLAQSKIEAAKRIKHRDSLQYKSPHELTNDECWFIGFWIGDGSKTHLQSGGVEFTLGQSERYIQIISAIDSIIESIGVDCIRRFFTASKSVHRQIRWSMPRGTGFGPQQRRGLFHLEHYLNKDGVDEFWCLSQSQFRALIEGLWFADGQHGSAKQVPDVLPISNTNKKLLDLLQAIASCRGYRTSLRKRENGPLATKPIYNLRLSPNTTSRQIVSQVFEKEESDFKNERVWCVNVDSTFIITRRNGHVAVLGNCEGWDLPHLESVIGGRPTRSRNLVKQMIGRLMRPDDDKRFAFLFDHADWTRTHGFVNEPETYSLQGRESRPRKGDAGAPVRECPDCQALCHISSSVCDDCGYEFPRRELQYTDEEFVELNSSNINNGRPRAHAIPLKERQENFNRWCLRCKEEEYKPNWARMQYQRVYGEWPSQQTGIATPRFFWHYQKSYEKAAKKERGGATA